MSLQLSSRVSVPMLKMYVPKTEPCGAPALTLLGEELACPTLTVMERPERKQASVLLAL